MVDALFEEPLFGMVYTAMYNPYFGYARSGPPDLGSARVCCGQIYSIIVSG